MKERTSPNLAISTKLYFEMERKVDTGGGGGRRKIENTIGAPGHAHTHAHSISHKQRALTHTMHQSEKMAGQDKNGERMPVKVVAVVVMFVVKRMKFETGLATGTAVVGHLCRKVSAVSSPTKAIATSLFLDAHISPSEHMRHRKSESPTARLQVIFCCCC